MHGVSSSPSKKIVHDYEVLRSKIESLRSLDPDNLIVCTIGSWDNLHIGHVRYLIEALKHGTVLVVGVDSDRGIKAYKGPLRPVIPEVERCEMLSYQEPVSYVTLVDDIDNTGRWEYELIKVIRPDVFIAVEDSYPQEQIAEIKEFCGDVVVLPRQAETSTSKTIHDTVKNAMLLGIPQVAEELSKEISETVSKVVTPVRIAQIIQEIEERGRS